MSGSARGGPSAPVRRPVHVVLLFPLAVVLRDFGLHALLAGGLFIALLGVAFVYEWRRGALDWVGEDRDA